MPKKGKIGKNRQDKFYHLAKEQGFRSRAAFKLVQLNKRHDLLSSASRGVLDLCAAPGGWMQVARKHMPLSAPCIGIDLVPIRPVPGCVSVVGDITADTTRSTLLRSLRESGGGEKVDVVLNDGSPNMGKAWLQDAYTQSELALAALKLSTEFLAAGGAFVTKVFRSNDYNSLLFVMHQLFNRVNATKPSASRTESAEIYVMCLGFKAPKHIDSRLLNPKYVFKDMSSASISEVASDKPDLFLSTVLKDMKKKKRNRDGYKDSEFTMFKKVSVLEFCNSSRPVALMVDASQFSFEPNLMADHGVPESDAKRTATMLENMPETTSELISCCEDLKVLARREFKLLLSWRIAAREQLRKFLSDGTAITDPSSAAAVINDNDSDGKDGDEGSGSSTDDDCENDEDLDQEVVQFKKDLQAAEKRKKRKANKARNAIQRKIDMKIILPEEEDAATAGTTDKLFSLKTARRLEKTTGAEIADVPLDSTADVRDDGYDGDAEQQANTDMKRLPRSLAEPKEAQNEAMEEAEDYLDHWYKVFLNQRKRDKNGVLLKESKERKRLTKRKSIREALERQVNNTEVRDGCDQNITESKKVEVTLSDSNSEDGAMSDEELDIPKESREAAFWFSQPMFRGVERISSDEEMSSEGEASIDDKFLGIDAEDITRGGSIAQEDFRGAANREAKRKAIEARMKGDEKERDFDVVPAGKAMETEGSDDADGSDSSFHSSDYDTDEKAEMVAVGRRMRASKQEGQDLVDNAYHRYTFDDPTSLPRWFGDQDEVYRERAVPVTKEHVEEMKAYIKSLQAAPTKKEAEAKARRRARVEKRVEAMKQKANSIAEQGDVSVSSRMKAIEDLYKQAMKRGSGGKGAKNKKKVYQVMKPNGRLTVGKNVGKHTSMKGVRTTLVDRRLKADKRGIEKAKRSSRGKKK